jgi:thiosulfate dehydrogenase [quinone] large subunit
MSKFQSYTLFALRITLGWLFFYAGWSKIVNPAWSAAGYLNASTTFTGFYQWLASPSILPVTNFLNEWGLTMIGLGLILGVFTRIATYAGMLLLAFYYLSHPPFIGLD